jgi:hypothetical protein
MDQTRDLMVWRGRCLAALPFMVPEQDLQYLELYPHCAFRNLRTLTHV